LYFFGALALLGVVVTGLYFVFSARAENRHPSPPAATAPRVEK
jgi:hypothetical protein